MKLSLALLIVGGAICYTEAGIIAIPKWVPTFGKNIMVYKEENNHRLAIVTRDGDEITKCELFGNTGLITDVMANLVKLNSFVFELVKVDTESMQPIIDKCVEVNALNPLKLAESLIPGAIYPGTKWCGAGNISKDFDDVSTVFTNVDMCCRTHDTCPDNIAKGEEKHNITNDLYATMSNCDCDEKFYNCLSDVSTNVADSVGNMYFNILAMPCFKEDYPIVKCVKKNKPLTRAWYSLVSPVAWYRTLQNTCNTYELDETKEKEWQVFDFKMYESVRGLV
jgi:hypothetical protein